MGSGRLEGLGTLDLARCGLRDALDLNLLPRPASPGLGSSRPVLLKRLDLAYNWLEVLPAALGSELANLERLSLSHNRLGGLGDGLGDGSGDGSGDCKESVPALPASLKVLNLAGNGLREVPRAVASCPELVEICLDLNKLANFPEVKKLRMILATCSFL
mmetsp:Transcript_16510/g.38225  ORF Transcript_16510/g.38225 Transcript_16510/m.38225 type:complete len:160 (-) Transcript_16510:536-1015(-)